MKKIVIIFLSLVFLCLSSPSYADWITINFDEIPAWNTAQPYIGNQYASLGVSFSPAFTNPDGAIYSGGTKGLNGTNGPQFLKFTGTAYDKKNKVYGCYIGFNEDIIPISLDLAWGADQGKSKKNAKPLTLKNDQYVAYTLFNDGNQIAQGQFLLSNTAKTWSTFNFSDQPIDGALFYTMTKKNPPKKGFMLGMDNLEFDPPTRPVVPLPASALLLVSGLVPLLRFRRRNS